ncbi:MAG: STAS/SEC14 domain-containing protein [Bacteroidota bacterium]
MRVFEHSTLSIDYFKDDDFFIVKRFVSDSTDKDEFKKLINEWRATIEKYKPKKQLIDYSEYNFKITPELQQYINDNLMKPAYEAGIRKVAFLLSHDLFSQMTIEKTMQKNTGHLFEIKYFNNFQKAKDWLLI